MGFAARVGRNSQVWQRAGRVVIVRVLTQVLEKRKIKKGFRTSKAFQDQSFDWISLLQRQQSQPQQQLNQLR